VCTGITEAMFVAHFVAAAFCRGCGQIFVAATSCAAKVHNKKVYVCHQGYIATNIAFRFSRLWTPSPPVDVMSYDDCLWRIRGKISHTVLCCVVHNIRAQ